MQNARPRIPNVLWMKLTVDLSSAEENVSVVMFFFLSFFVFVRLFWITLWIVRRFWRLWTVLSDEIGQSVYHLVIQSVLCKSLEITDSTMFSDKKCNYSLLSDSLSFSHPKLFIWLEFLLFWRLLDVIGIQSPINNTLFKSCTNKKSSFSFATNQRKKQANILLGDVRFSSTHQHMSPICFYTGWRCIYYKRNDMIDGGL